MSEQQIINQIDGILNSIKENLGQRKNRNWINNPISILLEEVLCSMKIRPTEEGFELTYKCKGDSVVAYFPENTERINHYIWEILVFLEVESNGGSLPIKSDLCQLKKRLRILLQLISPNEKLNGLFLVV